MYRFFKRIWERCNLHDLNMSICLSMTNIPQTWLYTTHRTASTVYTTRLNANKFLVELKYGTILSVQRMQCDKKNSMTVSRLIVLSVYRGHFNSWSLHTLPKIIKYCRRNNWQEYILDFLFDALHRIFTLNYHYVSLSSGTRFKKILMISSQITSKMPNRNELIKDR